MKTNNKWLQQSQQSQITLEIQRIAKKLKRSNELDTIFNIIQWNSKNIKYVKNTKWRTKQLRARTADEIIKSKKSSGCGDKSLVFAILARANNIPARLVEAIDNDWLLTKKTKGIYGHVFVDVYIDKKWRIVDPTMGTININYRWPSNKKFIVYKKDLDFWKMNIKSLKDLERALKDYKKHWKKKSKKFDKYL